MSFQKMIEAIMADGWSVSIVSRTDGQGRYFSVQIMDQVRPPRFHRPGYRPYAFILHGSDLAELVRRVKHHVYNPVLLQNLPIIRS